jgi:hypothetical protein
MRRLNMPIQVMVAARAHASVCVCACVRTHAYIVFAEIRVYLFGATGSAQCPLQKMWG